MAADYYQTLGVERNASKSDLKQAFRKLAREYHPDVNDSPDAKEKFNEISTAYSVRDLQSINSFFSLPCRCLVVWMVSAGGFTSLAEVAAMVPEVMLGVRDTYADAVLRDSSG